MAAIDLTTLLELVGNLNDSTDKGSASDRFRNYLQSNVSRWAEAREYIEEALKHPGDQYNKALQDLINHLGHLLGFDVSFGRYRGVRGQVGYDGLWQSPSGWSIVVETKTTDVYTIRTDTLLGYVNSLVSDGRISGVEQAVGLYVYGRFDRHTNQLENAIAIENRRNQLRVVSVPALLGLLELKQEYGLSHDSILGLLLPAPIRIDPIVELIRGVVAQEQERDVFAPPPPHEMDLPISQVEQPEPPTNPRKRGMIKSADTNFTGKSVQSLTFRGTKYTVNKWKEAFETLLDCLVKSDKDRFKEVAPTLVGRKRPYLTVNPGELRQPEAVSDTNFYFETNLSAQHLTRLAWELVERMGYDRNDLKFETD